MLVAWYDFGDISTLFQDTAMTNPVTADGQTIQAVRDKSGSGLHMNGSTGNHFPTYIAGYAGVFGVGRFRLDGASSMNLTAGNTGSIVAPGDFTVVGIAQPDNGANNIYLWTQRDPGIGTPIRGQFSLAGGSGSVAHFRNDAGGLTTASMPSITTDRLQIAVNRLTGTNLECLNAEQAVEGSTTVSGVTTNITQTWIGCPGSGGTPPSGHLAEVRVFNHSLSAQELRGETTYLYSKWLSTRGQPTARPSLKRNR